MKIICFLVCLIAAIYLNPGMCWAIASNNVSLDSPVYSYIEKLVGLGLITSDVKGVRPYAKAEVARLLQEAEENMAKLEGAPPPLAAEIIGRVRELVPRERALRKEPDKAPFLDYNPLYAARLRYVYLDGVPRSYDRDVYVRAGQRIFGFLSGPLRPPNEAAVAHEVGTEGTPLLENNEGVIYRHGNNAELRWSMEGFITSKVSVLAEPLVLYTPDENRMSLQKGYIKLGGGGLELEVGRDANWFGPGYRGALTLTNNAKNLDLVKLSSPEPLDVAWVKKYIGELKYALIVSRFNETGSGDTFRKPWFVGIKLAVKPEPWFEYGGNFVRQEGGPGFSGSTSLYDMIFGGGYSNKSNTIAGIDLRFRIPWLRNTEVYAEYAGENTAGPLPFVESYVAGFFVPLLTCSGKDDFRFEFFYGNTMLYTDGKFPDGYVYNNMFLGHSQGGSALEFFTRYSHWFSARNNLALEYFHTDRGREGKLPGQALEKKNALRGFWTLPVYGDMDMQVMYGWERIGNFNLVDGAMQTNQVVKVDLTYRY
jgi:Capsule assembly protein Wzi